jgi:DNA-binding transcriptional MerR regulator
MIRIGDFSKLSRVSVKTLRFCDEMLLLKPVEVDRFTGCRHYKFDQLPHLYRTAGFAAETNRTGGFHGC